MKEELKKFTTEKADAFKKAVSEGIIEKAIEAIKSATESGSFEIIVSSEHMDRQGEIVMQDGIDTANYLKNPVVLNSHDYWSVENIVAATDSLEIRDMEGVKCTVAKGKFAPTETGQMARALYDGGFLNAASIGFIPKSFDASNDCIITTCEMLEWSFCSVPANAAATRLNSIGITEDALRSKGFSLKEEVQEEVKAPQMGDTCTMDDGSAGTMQDDGNGGMSCKINEVIDPEKTAEETIADPEAEKAIEEPEKKDAQQIGAILAHTQNIIDEAFVTASKEILAIFQSQYAQTSAGKAEIAEVLATCEPLKAIKLVIVDAEKKLGIVVGEESSDGASPKERPEDTQAVSFKELNDFLFARELVASVSKSANVALSRLNTKIREARETRRLKKTL